MIAKHIAMHSLKKSSFAGLVDYITDAQSKAHRLGEVTLTNCAGHDVEMATLEILATQQQNTRAQSDKTFHLLVSFRPDEKPDAATLKAIEAKLCEGLGFGEHQRISAVHHDTDNLHIHIAINKIHPERLTIHEPYYPYKTLAKLCANLEQEYGLQVDNHEPKRTVAEGRAMDMEHHSGMESLLGWIQRECLPEIKAADSWEKLHEVMQGNGLSLHVKANGVVFESQKTGVQVKASSVARDLSKSRLEARLGVFVEAGKMEGNEAEKSAQQTQPSKQYEKKPIPLRIDTSALYARYKFEQENIYEIRKIVLEEFAAKKAAKIKKAKNSASMQRNFVSILGGGGLTKRIQHEQISNELVWRIENAHKEYLELREELYKQGTRKSWADWLKYQAEVVEDKEALAVLRARQSKVEQEESNRRTLQGQSGQPTGSAKFGAVALEQDNITKKGTVIYRLGASSVRESSNGLQIPKDATPQQMQRALRFAMQQYGKCLAMTGDLEFKAQMIKAAVDSGLPVTFADPLLEKKRLALSGEQHANQANGHRGGTGRNASRLGQSAAPSASADNATRGIGSTAGQPHLGRPATPPPPVARDRMRGLSQRGLAGLKTGIEMLLPPVVSIFLRQPGTESDSLLRRGRGLFEGVVSEAKKALQATKAQENAAAQGKEQSQSGGRGL